jgi:hypothetical protein
VPGPFLATTVAARLAATGGDHDLAGALLAGEQRAAWLEPAPEGSYALDATGASVGVAVDGSARLVDLAGLDLTEVPSLDEHTPLHRGGPLPSAGAQAAEYDVLRARVLLAAMLAGIAEATTAQSVEYGKDREQFGQPIGGFQAVKHRCADMAVRAEASVMQVRTAALATAGGLPDAGFHVDAARVVATNAAIENAQTNVQNHGGIGFTWEHTAHRYVTRARVLSELAGGRFAALADLLQRARTD